MHRVRRGGFAPLVVLFVLFGLLGQPLLATAQISEFGATETPVPTEIPATEVPATDVPATEVPATDVPATEVPATEVPATEIPATEIPATDMPPTATDVPAEDASLGTAAINQLTVQFQECEDSNRVGVTDFFFDGAFSAAAVGTNCVGQQYVAGSQIQITIDDGGSNIYTVPLDGSGFASFSSDVPEGTYSVFVTAGEEYIAVMQGQIVLEENGNHDLRIVRYVEGEQTGPTEDGTASVTGTVYYCRDAARDGQVDVLVESQVVDQVQAQAEASDCAPPQQGQTNLTFGGDDFNGRPYSQSISAGTFSLFPVPYSASPGYTFTNNDSGEVSDPVVVGGSNGSNLNLTVYVYYAEEAPLLANLLVAKTVCAVPEGDDRAGTSEFVIIADGGVGAAATCYAVDEFFDPPLVFTLSRDGTAVGSEVVTGSNQGVVFEQLQPGTYTLSESQEGGYAGTSDPFTLAYGDRTAIQVINYVAGGDGGEPTPGGFFYGFQGVAVYCTSEELAGTVDFLIQQSGGPAGDPVSAQGTSECRYAEAGEGEVAIRVFATAEGGEPELVQEVPAVIGPDGRFWAYTFVPLQSSYSFQVVFRTGSFDEEFASDTFSAPIFSTTNLAILVYLAPSDATTDLGVTKDFCFDAARDGETDFFVNERPAPEPDSGGIPISGAATTECLPGNYASGTITYTLTNTATGEVATRTVLTSGFPFGVATTSFTNVPAGTYTLREQAVFGEGEESVSYDATSEPFTVADGVPYYEIAVKNYTGDDAPDGFQENVFFFGLDAFTCADDTRDGEFDYFYQGFSFQPTDTLSAAATSECVISTPGEYDFVLEGPLDTGSEDGGDVSAQAIYPLTPTGNPDSYQFVYTGEPLPSGTYVIRELNTDSESEPIVLDEQQYGAEFYYYVAAPTPTPTLTPVPTATATATATLEPGVTPTATATLEPGVTPTVDPADPTRISQTPPGGGEGTDDNDGDGIPDPEDPDDDNDGVPDDEDPAPTDPNVPGGDVTELPSTGQGSQGGTQTLTWAALAGALVLLALAWAQALRARR